jgi:hypothetical protein
MSNHSEDDNKEDIQEPFQISKMTLSTMMSKYLSRKFAEDVDYLNKKGGIIKSLHRHPMARKGISYKYRQRPNR